MNILLSNDDGVFSEGMRALALELSAHHHIVICAPETQRSGAGHGITCVHAVRAKEVKLEGLPDIQAYSIDGMPADCVRIGCTSLDIPVDIIVSGINHGANLGSDVFYSGTVGAAMEGALLGKPAIAVSSYNHRATDFSAAARAASWAVGYVQANPLPFGMILNVNAPDLPLECVKGIRTARLCLQTYGQEHAHFIDPHGMHHFWMPLEDKTTDFERDSDYDEYWVREGYITVTPLHYDITQYAYMEKMDVTGAEWKMPPQARR